jgi:hypothetical protein
MSTSPLHLALALEANGPRATLSARAWQTLGSLLRVVDPDDHDTEISHRALAHRAGYTHPRTVSRALRELVDAGLVEYVPGDRDGHGTTDVHVSYVRVLLESVDMLLDAGREYIARVTRDAWSATQARMRFLLDHRARARARRAAVEKVAGRLAFGPDERQTRRSPVVDSQSPSPRPPGPDGGGRRDPDRYVPEICPHDWQLSMCKRCKP